MCSRFDEHVLHSCLFYGWALLTPRFQFKSLTQSSVKNVFVFLPKLLQLEQRNDCPFSKQNTENLEPKLDCRCRNLTFACFILRSVLIVISLSHWLLSVLDSRRFFVTFAIQMPQTNVSLCIRQNTFSGELGSNSVSISQNTTTWAACEAQLHVSVHVHHSTCRLQQQKLTNILRNQSLPKISGEACAKY